MPRKKKSTAVVPASPPMTFKHINVRRSGLKYEDEKRKIEIIRVRKGHLGFRLTFKGAQPKGHEGPSTVSFGATDEGAKIIAKLIQRITRGANLSRWIETRWDYVIVEKKRK